MAAASALLIADGWRCLSSAQFVANAQHLTAPGRAHLHATHAVHVDWLLQRLAVFVERVADPKVGLLTVTPLTSSPRFHLMLVTFVGRGRCCCRPSVSCRSWPSTTPKSSIRTSKWVSLADCLRALVVHV